MKQKLQSSNTIDKKYQLKYFDLILCVFIATLIISNIGSTKIVAIGPLTFDGGTILFPLAYVIGDIMTEVYGFKMVRRAIWLGFLTLLLMIVTLGIIQHLPAASSSTTQEAFEQIVGFIPRLAVASVTAYMVGQFINATIISKLKIKMEGRSFWLRSFSSSGIGEFVDTVIFCVIAFAGLMSNAELARLVASVYVLKLLFQAIALPFSAWVAGVVKKREGLDVYDIDVDYSPFSVSKG